MPSKFVTAVIARNAPHLDESQVAALLGMDEWDFDGWVRSLDEPELATLAIQLQEWEREALALLRAKTEGMDPLQMEFIEDGLMIWTRRTPFGKKLAMPTREARRASSPLEAAAMVLGRL